MLIKLKDGTEIGKLLKNGFRNLTFNCKNCETEFVANIQEGAKINPPCIESLGYCECPVCHKTVNL